jgi:hypothetical protein
MNLPAGARVVAVTARALTVITRLAGTIPG